MVEQPLEKHLDSLLLPPPCSGISFKKISGRSRLMLTYTPPLAFATPAGGSSAVAPPPENLSDPEDESPPENESIDDGGASSRTNSKINESRDDGGASSRINSKIKIKSRIKIEGKASTGAEEAMVTSVFDPPPPLPDCARVGPPQEARGNREAVPGAQGGGAFSGTCSPAQTLTTSSIEDITLASLTRKCFHSIWITSRRIGGIHPTGTVHSVPSTHEVNLAVRHHSKIFESRIWTPGYSKVSVGDTFLLGGKEPILALVLPMDPSDESIGGCVLPSPVAVWQLFRRTVYPMLHVGCTEEAVWEFSHGLHKRVKGTGGRLKWPTLDSFKNYFNRDGGRMIVWHVKALHPVYHPQPWLKSDSYGCHVAPLAVPDFEPAQEPPSVPPPWIAVVESGANPLVAPPPPSPLDKHGANPLVAPPSPSPLDKHGEGLVRKVAFGATPPPHVAGGQLKRRLELAASRRWQTRFNRSLGHLDSGGTLRKSRLHVALQGSALADYISTLADIDVPWHYNALERHRAALKLAKEARLSAIGRQAGQKADPSRLTPSSQGRSAPSIDEAQPSATAVPVGQLNLEGRVRAAAAEIREQGKEPGPRLQEALAALDRRAANTPLDTDEVTLSHIASRINDLLAEAPVDSQAELTAPCLSTPTPAVRTSRIRVFVPAPIGAAAADTATEQDRYGAVVLDPPVVLPTAVSTFKALPPLAVCSMVADDLALIHVWPRLEVVCSGGVRALLALGFPPDLTQFPDMPAVLAAAINSVSPSTADPSLADGALLSSVRALPSSDEKAWRAFAAALDRPRMRERLTVSLRAALREVTRHSLLANALILQIGREFPVIARWEHLGDPSALLAWFSSTVSAMAGESFAAALVNAAECTDEGKIMPSKWVISPRQPLGRGSFGSVLSSYLQVNSLRLAGAVKVQSLEDGKQEAAAQLYLSADPFLPPVLLWCYGESVCRRFGGIHFSFVPKMGPTLESLLEPGAAALPHRLTSELAWRCTFDLLAALAHLERMCILHSDIKPANLLFSSADVFAPDTTLALADFGVSILLDGPLAKTRPLGFTPCYAAPEAHGNRLVDTRADVWMAASTVHHMWFGRPADDDDVLCKVEGRRPILQWTPPPAREPDKTPADRDFLLDAAGVLLAGLLVSQKDRPLASSRALREILTSTLDCFPASTASMRVDFEALMACESTWPWDSNHATNIAHRHHFLSHRRDRPFTLTAIDYGFDQGPLTGRLPSFAEWVRVDADGDGLVDDHPSGGSGVSFVEGRRLSLETNGVLGRDDSLWDAHARDVAEPDERLPRLAVLEYERSLVAGIVSDEASPSLLDQLLRA
ncbi:MAG: protein kinase, partial [Actinomycetota bacterium]|nr:protein kinase [Actinomycetota bacterium]